jgi:hypothetical protein
VEDATKPPLLVDFNCVSVTETKTGKLERVELATPETLVWSMVMGLR